MSAEDATRWTLHDDGGVLLDRLAEWVGAEVRVSVILREKTGTGAPKEPPRKNPEDSFSGILRSAWKARVWRGMLRRWLAA